MEYVHVMIRRHRSLTGAAMPFRIMVNGRELTKLNIGQKYMTDLPKEQFTLKISMVGNAFTFHKLEKEVVVFPAYCKRGSIYCDISVRINWLGCFTFGIFQAVGYPEVQIRYE